MCYAESRCEGIFFADLCKIRKQKIRGFFERFKQKQQEMCNLDWCNLG